MKEPHWIYAEITKLEDQLEDYWDSSRKTFRYHIRNGKVHFDRVVSAAQRQHKIHLFRYITRAKLLHIITAPFIYVMIVPLVLLDLSLNIYQQICFRAYGIPRVRRRDYLRFDRHRLSYLNSLEKLNCLYCSYGNGMVAFAREVLARTEQYWCPIKHARRIKNAHARYGKFVDYGDAERYREQLIKLRTDFEKHPTNNND